MTNPALETVSADEWILREIDSLIALRNKIMTTPPNVLEGLAGAAEAAALVDLSNVEEAPLAAKLTTLWIVGRHALRAKIYRAALRNVVVAPVRAHAR